MAEYIEREALEEELAELRIFITGLRAEKGVLTEFACQYRNSILKAIDEFPAADVVEHKCGEWEFIGADDNGMPIFRCTNCKTKRYGTPNFCSKCGADMRGEK